MLRRWNVKYKSLIPIMEQSVGNVIYDTYLSAKRDKILELILNK
jgi:hypothetical protein